METLEKLQAQRTTKSNGIADLLRQIANEDALPRIIWGANVEFAYVSKSFAEMLNYEISDLVNHRMVDFLIPIDVARFKSFFVASFKAGKNIQAPQFYRFVNGTGQHQWVKFISGINIPDLHMGTGQVSNIDDNDILSDMFPVQDNL